MPMSSSLRKLALTVHIGTSVAFLGTIAAFLTLAIVGLTSLNEQAVRGSYLAMEVIAWYTVLPLGFASLLFGTIISLGTSWGLIRYYWVIAKLLLTTFAVTILVLKMNLIGHAAELAAQAVVPSDDLRGAGRQLAFHAGGGVLLLLLPLWLSTYKPSGLTPYGLRVRYPSGDPAKAAER
jgi:hypothetical protein